MKGIEYVVNEAGERKAVLIDLTEHAELWNDFYKALQAKQKRSEAARKANATRSKEQRSEVSRKANASRSEEQRSEAARKASATRKANRT